VALFQSESPSKPAIHPLLAFHSIYMILAICLFFGFNNAVGQSAPETGPRFPCVGLLEAFGIKEGWS
jgi:hypothetical protein